MGGLPDLGEAAVIAAVGLEDIDRLALDQLAQPPAVAFHLAGGDGDGGGAAQIRQSPGVVLVQGLLEPGEVAVLDRAAEHLGLHRRKQIVGVDHQIDVIADAVADRAYPRRVLAPAPFVDGDDHLEAGKSVGDMELRRLDQLVPVVLGEAVGDIDRRARPMTAQKLGHGAVGVLAGDVPERHVEQRQRHGDDARHRPGIELRRDPGVDGFGIARVHVPDGRQEVLLKRGDDGLGEEMAGQPVADDAVIGLDLAEDEVALLRPPVALDLLIYQRHGDRDGVDRCPDILDFHRYPKGSSLDNYHFIDRPSPPLPWWRCLAGWRKSRGCGVVVGPVKKPAGRGPCTGAFGERHR